MRRIGIAGVLLLFLPACSAATATITRHTVRAEIEPFRSRLAVADRISLEGGGTSTFRFLLHKDLEVTSIARDGKALRWNESAYDPSHWGGEENLEGETWETAREVAVSLPRQIDDSTEVVVEYEGIILDSLHEPTEAYARSFQTTTGLIEERGAYLSGSTVWLPTIPGNLFSFRLEVKTPRDWECVSQGAPEGRYEEGSRRITRWSSEDPMEEVYVVAGPYLLRDVDYGTIRIQTYLYEAEDAEELHERYVAATRTYLDRYSREIGAYPFPKFALVENFWQTGFGMPSFTLLGDQVIRLPFILYTSYGHEILHNWWGNGVYVDWEKGNWCEGLTAYGADYAYKEEKSDAEAIAYRRGELQKYRNYVSGAEDFPLVEFRSRSSASTQAVGYSKTMMVFHMLRREIGDGPFREGERALFRERKFRVSSWDDVRHAFEEASGHDLSDYFRQWTERTGAPLFSLTDVKAKKRWRGGYSVEGIVRQEEPRFTIDVPVRIETEAGTESLTVYLEGEKGKFKWKGDDRPLSVAVDPDFDLFRRLDRAEIPPALSQTLGADSVLIVLPPPGARAENLEALEKLARSWAQAPGATIARGEVPDALFRSRAVWLLGPTVYTERFLDGLPSGAGRSGGKWVTPAGEFDEEDHSVVFTARHPANDDLSWSLLYPGGGDVVAALGRKIPHYGKYGFLIFEGTRNVGKGEWRSTASPLLVPIERLE